MGYLTLQRLTAQGRALAQRLKPQSASSLNVLGSFGSILGLVAVVSSLRYELAIAVPEDDDEAVALVWLCFGL
jgi:hypothetical protein